MHFKHQAITVLSRMTVCTLLATLAACGGSSKQHDSCELAANLVFPIINGLACHFGTSDAGSGKPVSGGVAGFSPSANISAVASFDEYEPNSTLDNANPLPVDGDAVIGLAVDGRIASSGDGADHFVFTPVKSGVYEIYLCNATCDQVLESEALTLMILDQSQSTIAGTPIGTRVPHGVLADLDAGLAYYVQVGGYGDIAAPLDYRLVIVHRADGPQRQAHAEL